MSAPVTPMSARLWAEFLGTFWLVLGGCGSAVLAAKVVGDDGIQMGIGFLGVALAFGLTVLTGVYAFGPISGGHFNPSVTVGLFLAGRVEGRAVAPYIVTQVVGGAVAASVLFLVASGQDGFAGIAIGLTLTIIHLIAIPVTNTSVNPARSLAVAFFNPAALGQVWLFIVAPLLGAAIAGLSHKVLTAARA